MPMSVAFRLSRVVARLVCGSLNVAACVSRNSLFDLLNLRDIGESFVSPDSTARLRPPAAVFPREAIEDSDGPSLPVLLLFTNGSINKILLKENQEWISPRRIGDFHGRGRYRLDDGSCPISRPELAGSRIRRCIAGLLAVAACVFLRVPRFQSLERPLRRNPTVPCGPNSAGCSMPGSPISFRSLILARTHARWYFWWIRAVKIPQTRSSKAIAGGFSYRPCHQTIFRIPNRPEDIASRISRQKPFSHTGIIHPGW
ncbi:hypothetical protein OKW41_007524 [Paraburkholderia sp. UCT70]